MGDKLLLKMLSEFNNRLKGVEDKELNHCKDLEYILKNKLEFEKIILKYDVDIKGLNLITVSKSSVGQHQPSRQNTPHKNNAPTPLSKSKDKNNKGTRPKLMSANFNASTPTSSNLNLTSKTRDKVNSTANSNSKSRPLSRNDTKKIIKESSNSKLKGNTVTSSSSKSKIPPTKIANTNTSKPTGVKARQKTPAKKIENGSSAEYKSVITTDSTKQRISTLKSNLMQATETNVIEVLSNDKIKQEEEDYQNLTGKTPIIRKESVTDTVLPLEHINPIQIYNKVASPKGVNQTVRVYSQYTLKDIIPEHLHLIFDFSEIGTKITLTKINKRFKNELIKDLLINLSSYYKEKASSWNLKLQEIGTVSFNDFIKFRNSKIAWISLQIHLHFPRVLSRLWKC